jgi:hypothetical protein
LTWVLVLLAPGYPGVGTFQAIASLITVLVAILLLRVSDALAGSASKLLSSPYAAPVAMAATVLLGAWLGVLVAVSPVGRQGPVRCAHELRPRSCSRWPRLRRDCTWRMLDGA